MRCFLSTLPRGFQTWLGGKSGHQSSKKFIARPSGRHDDDDEYDDDDDD
jgi:hypothetical protein